MGGAEGGEQQVEVPVGQQADGLGEEGPAKGLKHVGETEHLGGPEHVEEAVRHKTINPQSSS